MTGEAAGGVVVLTTLIFASGLYTGPLLILLAGAAFALKACAAPAQE